MKYTKELFIEKAKQKHSESNYDYSNVEYIDSQTKVEIICNKHGSFYQTPASHLSGRGCNKCGREVTVSKLHVPYSEYLEYVQKKFENKFQYPNIEQEWFGVYSYITVNCPEHGNITQSALSHKQSKHGCSECEKKKQVQTTIENTYDISKDYIENVYEFFTSLKIKFKQIDNHFVFDEQKVIIYFWQTKSNNINTLTTETINTELIDYKAIHVFEHEWFGVKHNIIKSRLSANLGVIKYKIQARKCIIKQVSSEQEKSFLISNHLQGYISSDFCYGLYTEINNKEYLVALMSFGKIRFGTSDIQKNTYELYRYVTACNTTVIGGASKLFKHFINQNIPYKIISYADRRFSSLFGAVYQNLGFEFVNYTQPNYFYITKEGRILSRYSTNKQSLIFKHGFDPCMTEKEMITELGYQKVYDCGNLKFEW